MSLNPVVNLTKWAFIAKVTPFASGGFMKCGLLALTIVLPSFAHAENAAVVKAENASSITLKRSFSAMSVADGWGLFRTNRKKFRRLIQSL